MPDERAMCASCKKEIREWDGRWFHVHNLLTFCSDKAVDENGDRLPEATKLAAAN